MAYSFKRILLTEILNIKRYLLPCHSRKKESMHMWPNNVSHNAVHWDAGSEKIPFLHLQGSHAGGGCYRVCLRFVLQGVGCVPQKREPALTKSLNVSEGLESVQEYPRPFDWALNNSVQGSERIDVALFWQPVQSCLCLSAFYRVTMTSPGLNRA